MQCNQCGNSAMYVLTPQRMHLCSSCYRKGVKKIIDLALIKRYVSKEDIGFLSLEDFLNLLNKEKGYLFHGSGTLIPEGQKLISKRGVLHVTDDGGVAIIKALFPNNLPGQTNLNYNLHKSGSQEVIIEGKPKGELIRQKGIFMLWKIVAFQIKTHKELPNL